MSWPSRSAAADRIPVKALDVDGLAVEPHDAGPIELEQRGPCPAPLG